MKSGMLFRLIFCLAIVHGYGHVSSEEMNGSHGENDPGEHRFEDIGRTVDEGAGMVVVKGDDGEVEGDAPGMSARGDGDATVPVDEGARKVVDEAGEASGKVGECTGTRFKKCR